jgi:hypothetical protein
MSKYLSDWILSVRSKKEDKKDREVRGGVALSRGLPQDVVTSMLPTGRGRF